MDIRTRAVLLLAFAAVVGTSSGVAQAPAAATPAALAQGDSVFHGKGNCYACHGDKAQGAVGPNLADAEWIHSDGSYEAVIKQITEGVAQKDSKSGIPMPPRGGSSITDDEVKSVAAYVYSLNHKPGS